MIMYDKMAYNRIVTTPPERLAYSLRVIKKSPFRAGALAWLLLLLLACTPGQAEASGGKEKAPDAAAEEAVPPPLIGEETPAIIEPRFAVIPSSARPGEPVTVAYSGVSETQSSGHRAVLLNAEGKRLTQAAFFTLPRLEGEDEIRAAVFAVPSTAAPGDVIIRIESGEGIIRELPFVIESREFHSETIHLDKANTELRTTPSAERTAEAQHLWAILHRTGTEIYSGDIFLPPLASTRRTSLFGSRRVFQYSTGTSDTSIHAGVDYGVPTGTEVTSPARGRVVFAGTRIITGNSVMLEHLPGVYSLYYHLDTIAVSEGAIVEAGELLGSSGATGLATGPHLHWEIRVSTENADPDAFLSLAVLDKTAIINKLIE